MNAPPPPAAADQERYARLLALGTHAGLATLVLLFGVYMFGVVDPHIPHQRLPDLWHLPANSFLEIARIEAGWGWTAIIHRADVLTLIGIVTLAFCSVPCLLAVMPLYWATGQRMLFAICGLEVAVITLAASGFIGGAH
jgi:hypothetical protein